MHYREYPVRPILGVGGVIIESGKTLLVRRGAPPLEGEWSIPGGALEVGETLEQGVRREINEETGLDVRVLELIEVFGRIQRNDQGRVQYHYVILDYLCRRIGGTARAASDVLDVAWVGENDLPPFSLTSAAANIIGKAFEMSRRHALTTESFSRGPSS